MKLSDLLQNVEYKSVNYKNIDIHGIEHDSRNIKQGDIYVCLKGLSFDGHAFAKAACDEGAVCIVTEKTMEDLDCVQIIVEDSRSAYSVMASNWYGNPYEKLKIIAVTGTNGKTTTAHMIGKILNFCGRETAVLGSLGAFIKGKQYKQKLNTPDPMDFHARLRQAADSGCEFLVMETSAHGLYLKKTEPVKFAVGIFTNLTQDHLDDFGTMENYKQAKKILFDDEKCEIAVINADDEECNYIEEGFSGEKVLYGLSDKSTAKAVDLDCKLGGADFNFEKDGELYPVNLKLPGKFNVYNCLAAMSACISLGLDVKNVIESVEKITTIDGRMESVDCGQDFLVLVDYAHTPDSLKNVLNAAKGFTQARVLSVFGCGGDRDSKKRPIMGQISGELADVSIVTSDNPRTENPDSIIDTIEEGMKDFEHIRITDREKAIIKALEIAKKGDVVVIAGKGHETYQDVMGKKHHFDDREIVRKYFEEEQ